MNYALIYQRTEDGKEIYYRYALDDAKTRWHKLGEIHINHNINQVVTEDWSTQRVNGAGTG